MCIRDSHICLHAFFKRALFLRAGSFIHQIKRSQDSRNLSFSNHSTSLHLVSYLSILGLSGLPFYSSFFTKEPVIILLEYTSSPYPWLVIICRSALLTLTYSCRLLFLLIPLQSTLSLPLSIPTFSLFTLIPLCASLFISSQISELLATPILWSSNSYGLVILVMALLIMAISQILSPTAILPFRLSMQAVALTPLSQSILASGVSTSTLTLWRILDLG